MRHLLSIVLFAISGTFFAGCSADSADAPEVSIGSMTLFQAADDPAATTKLDIIIGTGVDLNAKDKEGMTALHHASVADNANAVKRLILAGADPEIQDAQGLTAEQVAKQSGKTSALRAFQKAK